jgi:hypothetical protein
MKKTFSSFDEACPTIGSPTTQNGEQASNFSGDAADTEHIQFLFLYFFIALILFDLGASFAMEYKVAPDPHSSLL